MDYKTLFSQYSKLEIDTGLIVPLTKVNKVLFGTNQDFPIVDKLTLLNTEIVVEKNKIYYLNLNKFDKYIDLIRNQNKCIPYFPYNYYNLFDKESLDYIDLFEPIKEYLEYLDTVNNQFSDMIKHIINPKNILNCDLLSTFNNSYCLAFDKIGKALFITLHKDNLDTEFGLSYNVDRNDSQYKKLFEQHKHMLLIETPEKFLITNLERVTGDETFATNIVKSYLCKNEFNTEISSICNLILWKNKASMISSIEKFKTNYPHLINENSTNFEGFNKFLLSLEVADLQQWEVKEQINELYYKITHELIRSFEILYLLK